MGFSITWCAVKDAEAEGFLADLGLVPTGETEEWPESAAAYAGLDTGWHVIWFNKYNSKYLSRDRLKILSAHRDLLLCLVEEHVMASSSEYWSQGKRQWLLSHEGIDGPKGLEVEGNPPETFPRIRTEMEAAQAEENMAAAEVDYIFEIPLAVAQALVGFKHDEDCPHLVDGHFSTLASSTAKRSLWSRLFG